MYTETSSDETILGHLNYGRGSYIQSLSESPKSFSKVIVNHHQNSFLRSNFVSASRQSLDVIFLAKDLSSVEGVQRQLIFLGFQQKFDFGWGYCEGL